MSNIKTVIRRKRRSGSIISTRVGLDNDEAALRSLDDSLSKALIDTFPASDPISSLRFE